MMLLGRWRLYAFAGFAVASVAFLLDGRRGMIGTLAAWLLCSVPMVIERVAFKAGLRKNSINHGLIAFPTGMFFRMVWILGGAAVIYHRFGSNVGLGFWLAVLVFYQVALIIQTGEKLHRRPS